MVDGWKPDMKLSKEEYDESGIPYLLERTLDIPGLLHSAREESLAARRKLETIKAEKARLYAHFLIEVTNLKDATTEKPVYTNKEIREAEAKSRCASNEPYAILSKDEHELEEKRLLADLKAQYYGDVQRALSVTSKLLELQEKEA